MNYLAAIFALLVAAAGWYYMFYSRAASNLAGIEQHALNAKRVRLRRVGGFFMFALGVCFFALFWSVDVEESPGLSLAVLLGVLVCLMIVVLLALADLRLTWKLRQERRRP